MLITEITICGSGEAQQQKVEPGKLTILVGPNNSGKSQFLRDIRDLMTKGDQARPTMISNMEFEKPATYAELVRGLYEMRDERVPQSIYYVGIGSDLISNDTVTVPVGTEASYDIIMPKIVVGYVSKLRVSFLDAESRLAVVKTCPSIQPNSKHPQTLLQALFLNREWENNLQGAFRSTFRMEIKFDYSPMTQFCFRIAKEFPSISKDPSEAFPVFSQYKLLEEQGDGFKSFTAVVLGLLSSDGRIVLIDEPEAFLHPTQARALGSWIAKNSDAFPGQIVIATHSASFLAGLLSVEKPVDIYRLNRVDDNNTRFTPITPKSTLQLATDPLLSSQSVLEAIFQSGVIVCEGDTDRIFYQAAASKLNTNEDSLFIHAHSKQRIKDVIKILKSANIPAATIVDFDILNSKETFQSLLEAFATQVPPELMKKRENIEQAVKIKPEQDVLKELTPKVEEFVNQLKNSDHDLAGARSALERLTTSCSRWTDVKEKGIEALPAGVKQIAEELIEDLSKMGIFVVPNGELESWIDNRIKQKPKWIISALEQIQRGNIPPPLHEFIKDVNDYITSTKKQKS